jgi:hypothetical protein
MKKLKTLVKGCVFLYSKEKTDLPWKYVENTENYSKIYTKVIRRAKKMENNRHKLNAKNKTISVWQIINKKFGKSTLNNKKTAINWGSNKLTSLKIIVELFE